MAKAHCSLNNSFKVKLLTTLLKSINAMWNSKFLTFSCWLGAF